MFSLRVKFLFLQFSGTAKIKPCCCCCLVAQLCFFASLWTAARQASLGFPIYWSLLKLMSIESVMPSNHLNHLCRPLLLLPSIFPSISPAGLQSQILWGLIFPGQGPWVGEPEVKLRPLTLVGEPLQCKHSPVCGPPMRVNVGVCSVVSNSVAPWTVACQTLLSVEFSRQEYWSGFPFPPPEDLPNPGIEPESLASPAWAGGFLTTSAIWETHQGIWDLAYVVKNVGKKN